MYDKIHYKLKKKKKSGSSMCFDMKLSKMYCCIKKEEQDRYVRNFLEEWEREGKSKIGGGIFLFTWYFPMHFEFVLIMKMYYFCSLISS